MYKEGATQEKLGPFFQTQLQRCDEAVTLCTQAVSQKDVRMNGCWRNRKVVANVNAAALPKSTYFHKALLTHITLAANSSPPEIEPAIPNLLINDFRRSMSTHPHSNISRYHLHPLSWYCLKSEHNRASKRVMQIYLIIS